MIRSYSVVFAKLLETLEQGAKTPSDAAKKTKEVDADKMADTLATDLDHYKAMKIHEEKLVKQLKAIREVKSLLKKRLLRNIKNSSSVIVLYSLP